MRIRLKIRSIAEAILNLGASIILVNIFQVRGVLLGTIIALLYRSNDIIIYANRKILQRSPKNEYQRILIFFLLFLGVLVVINCISLKVTSIGSFLICGFIASIFITFLYVIVAILTNYSLVKYWLLKIKK